MTPLALNECTIDSSVERASSMPISPGIVESLVYVSAVTSHCSVNVSNPRQSMYLDRQAMRNSCPTVLQNSSRSGGNTRRIRAMSYRSFCSDGFARFPRFCPIRRERTQEGPQLLAGDVLQRVGVRLMTANHDCRYGRFQQFFGGGHVDYDTGEASDPHLGEIIDVQPGLKCIPPHRMGFWRIGLDRQAPELELDRILPVKIPGYRPLHVTLEVTSLLRAIGVFLHESLHQIRVEIEGLSPASEVRSRPSLP